MLPFNAKRQAWWRAHLNETPWILEEHARQITLDAIRSVCGHRTGFLMRYTFGQPMYTPSSSVIPLRKECFPISRPMRHEHCATNYRRSSAGDIGPSMGVLAISGMK